MHLFSLVICIIIIVVRISTFGSSVANVIFKSDCLSRTFRQSSD
jgi:hypothetical protein